MRDLRVIEETQEVFTRRDGIGLVVGVQHLQELRPHVECEDRVSAGFMACHSHPTGSVMGDRHPMVGNSR